MSATLTFGAAFSAQPTSGTISSSSPSVSWTGGPFYAPNVISSYSVGLDEGSISCAGKDDPTCDHFFLNVVASEGAAVEVTVSSSDISDFDLYIYDKNGSLVARGPGNFLGEPEVAVFPHYGGKSPYEVRVQPYLPEPGATYDGTARLTGAAAPDPEVDCLELAPDHLGVAGVTDDGATINLDVAFLLDGVSSARAADIVTRAATSYAPLKVNFRAVSYATITLNTVIGPEIIQKAKDYFGGRRPAGSDVVMVLTSKNILSEGESADSPTSLQGQADCIGGVEFAHHAFGVVQIDDASTEGVSWPIRNTGPFVVDAYKNAKTLSHEVGHLMGAHHHYANCAEGVATETYPEREVLSACTLMGPVVNFDSLNFSVVNTAVVRGHADRAARP